MTSFAQTNLELYEQMRIQGYDSREIGLVKRAYFFAARARICYLRGSGKPFICHLVGTASILCALRQPVEVVAAGMLHAMYLKRSDFGDKTTTEQRRPLLQSKFGRKVESLVFRYHKFKWKYGNSAKSLADVDSWSERKRQVVTMRLANELEDFLDGGLLYCGKQQDQESDRKSVAWRLRYLDRMGDELSAVANQLGYPQLSEWIAQEITKTTRSPIVPELLSGRPTSFKVLPPSLLDKRSVSMEPPRSRVRKFFERAFSVIARIISKSMRASGILRKKLPAVRSN